MDFDNTREGSNTNRDHASLRIELQNLKPASPLTRPQGATFPEGNNTTSGHVHVDDQVTRALSDLSSHSGPQDPRRNPGGLWRGLRSFWSKWSDKAWFNELTDANLKRMAKTNDQSLLNLIRSSRASDSDKLALSLGLNEQYMSRDKQRQGESFAAVVSGVTPFLVTTVLVAGLALGFGTQFRNDRDALVSDLNQCKQDLASALSASAHVPSEHDTLLAGSIGQPTDISNPSPGHGIDARNTEDDLTVTPTPQVSKSVISRTGPRRKEKDSQEESDFQDLVTRVQSVFSQLDDPIEIARDIFSRPEFEGLLSAAGMTPDQYADFRTSGLLIGQSKKSHEHGDSESKDTKDGSDD